MKQKKIVIMIRALKSGGAEKQSILLAKALNDVYDLTLIVQRGEVVEKKFIKFLDQNEIDYFLITGNLFKRISLIYNYFKREKVDYVFSYLTSDNFWSAILGKLAGVKYLIGGIRSNFLPQHKFLVTKLLHHYFQDFIIFNNKSGYRIFMNKGFDERKSIIINNSVDNICPFIKRERSNDVILLTVARFVQEKDYLTAVKAFSYFLNKLCPANYHVTYFFIGFGELEEQIRKWVNKYELSGKIKILINPDNLFEYYRESDIYVCSSEHEGLSNSIIEAMSYSLPVIATDVGDNNSLVINDKTGYLVPIRDHIAIAEKVDYLIQHYDKRILFGEAGNQKIATDFSLNKFRENYMNLIEKLA